jgi:hypothetical protein
MTAMRTHDSDDKAPDKPAPRPEQAAVSPVQRRVLDLQQAAGNAAVAATIQRHSLDPDHADE